MQSNGVARGFLGDHFDTTTSSNPTATCIHRGEEQTRVVVMRNYPRNVEFGVHRRFMQSIVAETTPAPALVSSFV